MIVERLDLTLKQFECEEENLRMEITVLRKIRPNLKSGPFFMWKSFWKTAVKDKSVNKESCSINRYKHYLRFSPKISAHMISIFSGHFIGITTLEKVVDCLLQLLSFTASVEQM